MKTTMDDKYLEVNSEVKDYISLLKPRVMSLVIFSGLTGLLIAPGTIHPFLGFISILAISLGSGASAAINMWYDRDIDAVMERTKKRPIPAGKILPEDALQYGIILSFISVLIMAVCINLISATILLSAILFYVFIYTMWLKRTTPQNIVIGGAAGAFPPMIGWSAVTGNITIEPIILFLIIFFWTPPHFWALALYKNSDYTKAKVPMLPVTHGLAHTKLQILLYTILLIPITLSPIYIGFMHNIYLIGSILLNAYFLYLAIQLYRAKDIKLAPKLFGYSISYLFLLFGLMIADHYFIG
jgi:protoheme IX farnesyltransferase